MLPHDAESHLNGIPKIRACLPQTAEDAKVAPFRMGSRSTRRISKALRRDRFELRTTGQYRRICVVVRLVNPPMETSTWYEAPPPGAR